MSIDWNAYGQWTGFHELAFVVFLVNVLIGACFGIVADSIAFGWWPTHQPFQMHWRRAAIIISFVAAAAVFLR